MKAVMKRLDVRVLVALAALAVIARGTTPTQAFSPNGATWGQSAVTYVVNPANLDLPEADVIQAVRDGADVWFNQAGINFRFVYNGTSTVTTNTLDSANVVMFRNASSGSAIATTYSWFSGAGLLDTDIVFWDGAFRFYRGTTGCSGGFYIEDIAAHEFGHALGLGHSTVADATMFPSVSSCNQGPRSLSADDIAGARSLYPLVPAAPSRPTGLKVTGD
jgi:matrix metalloproteinase-14 (membrane-inserted)